MHYPNRHLYRDTQQFHDYYDYWYGTNYKTFHGIMVKAPWLGRTAEVAKNPKVELSDKDVDVVRAAYNCSKQPWYYHKRKEQQ